MGWRVWSVSSLDWFSKVRVSPASFSWSRSLNAGAGGSGSFAVGDVRVAETANGSTLAPWSRVLVAEFDDQIVYAGFITGTEYDRDSQTLSVTHEDIWSVLARRIMVDILEFGVEKTRLDYVGVSVANLVKQAVYQGQNDGVNFFLPIVLPADQAGSESRTYYGYHLPTVASILEDLIDDEGGPDVDFFPRWLGSQVEWLLRVGDLSGGSWAWDATAPKSRVSGLKVRRDGSLMANRVAAIGEGSERKMKVAISDASATSPYLPLDATTSYKDIDSQTRLAARARSDRKVREKPTEQVSMDVRMDDDFKVHQLRLGGTVKWRTQGDPYFTDGWKSSRLIEYSGDLSDKIHLEFQEA